LAGNLLNRTLGLLKKNCQSTLAVDSTMAAEGNAFKDNVARLVKSLGNSNISVISINHAFCSSLRLCKLFLLFCPVFNSSAAG